jgi:hypothetical protein
MLTSERHTYSSDEVEFNRVVLEAGMGDGLPVIAPTVDRVEAFLAESTMDPEEVIAYLPPSGAPCTVEKLAINAVMTAAPPDSLPLLRATIEAMAEPEFQLGPLNATTGSMVPAVIVNGPVRSRLGIPHSNGCLGGADGGAPAIGRAIRLVMRNVAGQVVGVTSQTTFGTPGRVAGIVFGEWEERSPWAPLAERRGVSGDAVTVFGAMGTMNICDTLTATPDEILNLVGRSIGYAGANGFLTCIPYSQTVVCLNPVWADIVAKEYPAIEDVQLKLWEWASLPIDSFLPRAQTVMEDLGRIDQHGQVHLVDDPVNLLAMVCGGNGALHAAALHGWGGTLAVTRSVSSA